MKLTINGQEQSVPDKLSVSGLLEHLQIHESQVAVEVNRIIVPRKQHCTRILLESDAVEIVSFVGGG
jgi:sulfur carrier protein